ncbi:hypothetical protein GGI17_005641 [Coemansia sp. S146]|nr:hypothetical protein GGI17_005641 [Coemansia sp. S146]
MKSFILLALSLIALVSAYPIVQDQHLTELDKCDEYQESLSTETYTGIPNIIEVDEYFLNSLGLIAEDPIIEHNDESVKRREIEERDQEVAPAVKANINEFVCRIKQMGPTLREIELEYGMHELEQDLGNDFFDTLLEPLLHLAPRIVHRTVKYKVDVKAPMDDISNLAHIDMEASDDKPIMQLARRSAATLEYLGIIVYSTWNGSALELIKDVDGDYVCYPQLRVLKLEHYANYEQYDHTVLPSVVPFPTLRILGLTGRCLFGDDVLFRGNVATLENLVLKTNHDDIIKLIEFGVFTPTSHPRLQCVKVLYQREYEPSTNSSYTDYWKLLLSIAPNAAVQGFPYNESRSDSSMISIFRDYPNIQVLGLPEV